MRRPIASLFGRVRSDERANVLMIAAFSMIPLTFSVGMGVDYARAARLQTKLNAVADAAALAAVTKPMMNQTPTQAGSAAVYYWYGQSPGAEGLVTPYYHAATGSATASSFDVDNGDIHVTVTDNNSAGQARTATVSWHAASHNRFGTILGGAQIEISGTSTTAAKQAPNIDFYVLLDSSGSMAFPSTSAGITQLQSVTGGCAFACHSTADATARTKSGTMADYYTVATSYGIPLRVDEARKAVQSMMSTATSTMQNNQATYRAALASFAAIDTRANNYYQLLAPLTSNLPSVSTAANNVKSSLYYRNNCPTNNYCNGDSDTATSDAFTRFNTLMPSPGNGTNQSGDTPQEIMFIITDGMRDEYRSSGRPEINIDTSLCTTIKSRGIRIGIIYTQYLQSSMDNDAWSQTNVVPYLSQVEPALQACASSGLYYRVTTDDDISAALNQLFQTAIATAHITR